MQIKAFYPAGIENIWHKSADRVRTYRLDAIEKIVRLREALKLESRLELIDVANTDPSLLDKVHTAEYLETLRTGQPTEIANSSGIMWQPGLVKVYANSAQCLIFACNAALEAGFAVSLGKGGHHTVADRGYGFGPVNEAAMAVTVLHEQNPDLKIALLDLDVHLGNGWQELLANKQNALLVDLWNKTIPKWGTPAPAENIHSRFVDSADDYLKILQEELITIKESKPDLIIYNCGLDVLETDRMGGIPGFSLEKLWQRESIIKEFISANNIPLALVTAGGYVDHSNTVKAEGSMRSLVESFASIIKYYTSITTPSTVSLNTGR